MNHAKQARAALASVVLASSALVVLAIPTLGASPATGYTGRWTAIDCATWWEEPHVVDCSIWGDGSVQTLTIGPGSRPTATYQDTYASVCAGDGFPDTRFVAAGRGEFDEPYLWVTYRRTGCGVVATGGVAIQYYHDAGSDTIWEDPDGDGWGLNWVRA